MRRITIGLLAAPASLVWAAGVEGAEVFYADTFDAGTSAGAWTVRDGQDNGINDFAVNFAYDYSGLGIGAAPKGGSSLGVRVDVNQTTQSLPIAVGSQEEGVSLYPNGQSFTGDFVLRFDMYMVVSGTAGTTESALFGINATGTRANWETFAGPGTDGVFYGITGDGGLAADYAGFEGNTAGDPTSFALYDNVDAVPQALFPASDGTPRNQWVQVEVSQQGARVSLRLNGTEIDAFTNTSAFTSGNIFLGYQDVFPSVNAATYILYDNVSVSAVPEPAAASAAVLIGMVALAARRRAQR